MTSNLTAQGAAASATRVLQIEAQAVAALVDRVDTGFEAAVAHLLASDGRTIVCGMGKSGIIAHKIAATLMSTGTPSFYMHPGEAYHGDLGMVTSADAFIAISNSGETDEVVKLLPYLQENGNFLIAFTGNAASTIAQAADAHIDVGVRQEACPLQLAPTASTTAALAMGDALAVALMEARGFSPEDFARFHPGGSLGRRLLSKVDDEMVADDLQIIEPEAGFAAVITAITKSRMGLTVVRDHGSWAIITDGDLRRAVDRWGRDAFELLASDMMTRNPATISLGTRMQDALSLMDRRNISALLVHDGKQIVGVVKR
ncbi:KpsF/GutQ family sugar-phosphate isomerase [Mycolicibacterium austroafricanum]|uniref:KpsF/GutQ family sugar-phosphate isomerase n=1 Tax=Mycolicibacterium austroafricanum TaxID=39687 RepID=A0ABT8HHU4_MYCAO|nr:KpsF/GutQ family sugar-phosphate isomerase [Mycolicibacterium austroafricanum]MDN4520333.1 KpsF/GutQ family sugar-phosphate isomerase [Mycolicibacterium austroafricanum]